MKIKFFSALMILGGLLTLQAQSILNASSPEDFRRMRAENLTVTGKGDTIKKEVNPLEYGFIEEKDVLWAKVVWEIIDLNERINQPYYNSSDGIVSSTLSLFDALKQGIESGDITEVYDDEFFKYKISRDEAVGALSRVDTTDWFYDQREDGIDMSTMSAAEMGIDTYNVGSEQIKMVKVKGMWYIDRRMGEMKYRILGISMMGPDAQTIGRGFDGADDYIDLFWIFYPNARETLHKYQVFNPQNAASTITFDDMLNARRFNTIIYKSSDAMGDRSINEYLPRDAQAQLEESNRIRRAILQRENDMWSY